MVLNPHRGYFRRRYSREIRAKGTLKKSCLPPRWRVDIDYDRLIWEDIINKLNKKTREKLSFILDDPVAFKAPKNTLKAKKKDIQGTTPEAKSGGKKNQILFLYNHPQSKIEAAKGVPSLKGDTGSQTSHSVKETQSSSAKDTNQSQPLAFIHVVAGMHKEASKASIAEADPGKLILMIQYLNNKVLLKELKPFHLIIYLQEIKYAKEEFNTSLDLSSSDETKKEIKLEDLSKLVPNLDVDFMDLDLPKDDQPIIVEDEEEKEELPTEFLPIPGQVSLVKAKIKTLEALPILLSKSSPQPDGELIKKDKGKKAMSLKDAKEEAKADMAKQEVELGKEELVDLLGIDVVKGFYKAKLQYIGRIELMKSSLTLKPVIYTLVNGKRSTKKFKSSVQYEDHLARIVVNEPCLGMIMFNSVQRQDFVTIENFGDFLNKMLYTVLEIFFRLHQGPRLDDHASTFSSLLLVEVDKRNLNPLKQMRAIEQLRQ
uniref:Retrovirus-related Pol polyprotein from transposon TNT 1-94 n=1 Tax=Tanacetum cinerariifolium TaxID=118510 RepID=A0A6L2JJE2_TANCI|nr:hypothetical protein [Tanacetum cinerariifolium]